MKKLLVNLYGGPGTGKSRTAASIFAKMKDEGVNSELVREYIKRWVWEERRFEGIDQTYIIAKQTRLEREVSQGVDFIVTDSPIWLSPFYALQSESTKELSIAYNSIAKHHYKYLQDQGYKILDVFLIRTNDYNPAGRIQTQKEAKELDIGIKNFLDSNDIKYITSNTGEKEVNDLISLFKNEMS